MVLNIEGITGLFIFYLSLTHFGFQNAPYSRYFGTLPTAHGPKLCLHGLKPILSSWVILDQF